MSLCDHFVYGDRFTDYRQLITDTLYHLLIPATLLA
jgi:hypothetical protein